MFIDKNCDIGEGVVIYPNNYISGKTRIGNGVTLLPNNFIVDCVIQDKCEIFSSVIQESVVGESCKVGPYSYLRPRSIIGNKCKIADFVEIKNSTIGDYTKISHLAYVGDSSVGERCNIGCGVIFVNYNGKVKQGVSVGNDCFIGSNCNLIAPLTIGNSCFVAAGTTVTKNVENGSFVIGRMDAVEKKERGKDYL